MAAPPAEDTGEVDDLVSASEILFFFCDLFRF